MLQIGNSSGCSGLDLIFLHRTFNGRISADERERRMSCVHARLVFDRLCENGDILRRILEVYRNFYISDAFLLLAAFLECCRNGNLKVVADQCKYIKRYSSRRHGNELRAVSVGAGQFIVLIHQKCGGHERFKDGGIKFVRRVFYALCLLPRCMDRKNRHIHSLHRVVNSVVGRCFAGGVVDEYFLICTDCAEHIVIINDRFGTPEEKISAIIQRHVEDSEKVPLKDSLEINQQVTAAYQVELSERRILENIVLSKHDHFPYIVTNKVLIPFPGKVTG